MKLNEILAAEREYKIGKVVEFTCPGRLARQRGGHYRVNAMITKINPKTIEAIECNRSYSPGFKWNIAKEQINKVRDAMPDENPDKLNEAVKQTFKTGDKVWHKSRQEVGIFKMLDDQNTPTNDCSWVEFPDSDEEVMVSSDKLELAGDRKSLIESKIKTSGGEIYFGWKKRFTLLDEESDDYLPEKYTKILELQVIQAIEIGKGYGKKLMEAFLSSKQAKEAHAIYLDINSNTPSLGHIKNKVVDPIETEDKKMDRLEKFYSQFGFKNNKKHQRMWIDKLGLLNPSKLPT